ncbi:MAG TPA: hypothetical protein VD907_00500 [Verrucomicrobiae bacterium]|nr:hypothetical protein [Verrucomicrobiae bacterium]
MEQQSKLHETKRPQVKNTSKQRTVLIVVAVVILVAIVAFLVTRMGQAGTKGNYVDSDMKATASFEVDLDFKRNCQDQKDCDPNKPSYDTVKIFVFDAQGTQVRVVRADKEGIFKAALPEGDYNLLVAKTFEGKTGLPQEQLSLKNGKTLKLQVNYGTEMAQKQDKKN